MEEITSTVAVPFTLGNLMQKESSAVTTHMELTGLKLMANTAAVFMLNPSIEGCQSFSVGSDEVKENQVVGADLVSEMVIEGDSQGRPNTFVGLKRTESYNEGRNEDGFMSAKDFQCIHNPSSQSAASDKSSTCREESPILKTDFYEMNSPNTVKVDDDNIHGKSSLVESEDGSKSDGADPKPFAEVHEMPEKHETCRTSCHNALELSSTPLWGFSSVCGRREEMEDAIAVEPQLFQVPSQMLMDDDHVNENTKHSVPAHYFGVYDGHGGCQVANYCQKRLHSVLIEEIEAAAESSLSEKNGKDNWQDKWKKAFSSCFHKVDDEIGGAHAGNDGSESSTEEETLAHETVGSTALVAILTQTHILVANCGDSRAVLCRGKEAMSLSDDHKPNREDEWERIEAAGGRVIHWNGYRVLGVLAVSRSIGDKYLKPWVIPEPEVKCILREKNDECLILASDGLWDVMTNEEACDIARKRILLWHKKNIIGNNNNNNVSSKGQLGHDHGVVDPAAQYAAEYLSRLALQRGSKDNISVIVIDLKAQRQFKRKNSIK